MASTLLVRNNKNTGMVFTSTELFKKEHQIKIILLNEVHEEIV